MPVHVLRHVRVVHHFHVDALPFSHADERARHLVVVADCADYHLRGQLHKHGRDSQGEVRRTLSGISWRVVLMSPCGGV